MVDGKLIRDTRKCRNLSLQDLAKKADISVSYLSEIERGKKQPSLETINKLSKALNIPKEGLVSKSPKTDISNNSLGERLYFFRKKKGLSISDLAKKVGISDTYLCQIEGQNVMPSISTLKKIAKALDVCPIDLMASESYVGYKLKKIRSERGLTQAELAKKASVSTGLIGQIESGKVEPSIKTLEKIAEALSLSPCYFVSEDDDIVTLLKTMNPEIKELLSNPQVHSALEMLADCSPDEFNFILKFIQIYKEHRAHS